jgi:hypothetical protein
METRDGERPVGMAPLVLVAMRVLGGPGLAG